MTTARPSTRPLASAVTALAGAGLWWLLESSGSDRLAALAAGLVLAVAAMVGTGRLGLGLLSPPMLYLAVLAMFHLGMALPWALGLYSGPFPMWFATLRLAPALALVALAMCAYLAGMLWGARPAPRQATVHANPLLFGCGVGIYLAGCAMFFAGLESFGAMRFFDASYAETYRLAAQFDPRLFGTSFTMVPIGLYLAAAGFPRRWLLGVILLAAIWVTGIFYLGFRGFAMIPALVVLAVLSERGYRAPVWLNLALAALALAAIPVVRAVRDQGARDRSWEVGKIHPLAGMVEMGGSLRPLVHTLAYLEVEPRRWGRTYWRSLTTVWPNLARRWEGGRYLPLDQLPPNHWLTAQAEPGAYRQYGGLGFSAVAEPYMNFGLAGVMGYFFGLGAILARAAARRAARPVRLAAWAVVLGPLLWTTRNSFEIFFRPAVWGLLIVAMVWLLSGILRSRREAAWAC